MAIAKLIARVTGIDMHTQRMFGVGGTDLGIPYQNEIGDRTNYLFGDTFELGVGSQGWRSPVGLTSSVDPKVNPIVFEGSLGGGYARELTSYRHVTDNRFGSEWTRIPNDGVSFAPGQLGSGVGGRQYISFHSVYSWPAGMPWRSNYSALAVSKDGGGSFAVIGGGRVENDRENQNPFQMVSIVKDPDGYVYLFSVKCGRQDGPMMLRRVRWDRLWDNLAYENWSWNGRNWEWTRQRGCSPILWGNFGEPSVRRLPDGTYVMAYLLLGEGIPKIVTRHAPRPDAAWTNPKIQLTAFEQPFLYGGFIHPLSTRDNLNMLVSTWGKQGNVDRYDVSHWRGSI